MSTRYVWEKFNRAYNYTRTTIPAGTVLIEATEGKIYGMRHLDYAFDAEHNEIVFEPEYDPNTGTFTHWGGYFDTFHEDSDRYYEVANHNGYKYFFFQLENDYAYRRNPTSIYEVDLDAATYTRFTRNLNEDEDDNVLSVYMTCSVDLTELNGKGGYQKGSTSYGYVAHTSSSKYSSDGYSGSYWYKKLGSDCIDPVSVTIPAEILPGDTITAALTARANTYGGTITYTFSYSVDGGSTWVSAGSTTATSLAITVPDDAEQFQVRVVAKDNYGFTSTTYVKSANVEVRRGAALLACIDGVLREIAPTVMVDGVLRELTEVHTMIDGVNRDLGAG